MFHYNKDKDGSQQNDATPMHSLEAGTSKSDNQFAPQSGMQALPQAEPGSRSLSEVDTGNDFGNQSADSGFGSSSAAAAAFDYASRNPDQAFAAGQAAYGFAQENPELAKKATQQGHAML